MANESAKTSDIYAGMISIPERKVSALLAAGIVLLPLIFVWFLLRAGYSLQTRIIGFSWLMFPLFAALTLRFIAPHDITDQKTAQTNNMTSNSTETTIAKFDAINVEVRADPGVQYVVYNVAKRPDGLIEVYSRRIGKSGTSYAKRLVNCKNWTFMYLAEGDTIEELSIPRPDPKMSQMVAGSSSTAISYHACKAAGLTD
jgi:hypothetical protein